MRDVSPAVYVPVVLTGVALCLFTAPLPASAAWPPFGRALSTASGNQLSPAIAADGADGAIVTWTDSRAPIVNLFAQRVLASGSLDPAWPADGSMLMTDPAALANAIESPAFPVIVSDGSGGAIVAWQHGRSAETSTDIFAQHILASGAVDPAWPANGVPLCVAAQVQDIPAIVSDGAGGAIVTWMDGRSFGVTSIDIYGQHVLSSGAVDPAWPANGRALCTAPSPQAFPEIVSDGAGGAIVTWFDFRSSVTSIDIFAQHVLSSGEVDPAWPADGRALCTASGEQFDPKIVPDGAGGAIVSWADARSAGTSRVFAQHVLASGAVDPAWPVDGRIVTIGGTSSEEAPNLAADGAGGAIVTWRTRINGSPTLHAQHLLGTGVVDPGWPANGRLLNDDGREKAEPEIAPDGTGGAIVVWQQDADIFAQRVLASGVLDPTYPVNGRALCQLPSDQRDPAIVAAAPEGAIVAWTDTRNGAGTDIFALQVQAAGTVGVPDPAAPRITFADPSPNPARASLTLRFTLPRESQVRLAIYDARGRRVRDLATGARPAGQHALPWDLRDEGGHSVRPGLYFARLEADGQSRTHKLVTLQ